MKRESYITLTVVGIFAIAMAFIETLIVVYLRMLYYADGFNFPLNFNMEAWVYSVEWVREFFTIVMLVCIAMLAAKKFSVRFAYFLYSFAVWDIFYYVWLKVILDWPASLLTWDVLFLIPIPWIGPVLTPLLCTVAMIAFALIIIHFKDEGRESRILKSEWWLLIIGNVIILYTWMVDFGRMILENGFASDFLNLLVNDEFGVLVEAFVPTYFNWPVFLLGLLLIVIAIVKYYLRVEKGSRVPKKSKRKKR